MLTPCIIFKLGAKLYNNINNRNNKYLYIIRKVTFFPLSVQLIKIR